MITFQEAMTCAQAAIVFAKSINVEQNIAVVNTQGRLVLFIKMDNAILAGGFGAVGKAVASALFNKPSSVLELGINPSLPGYANNPTLPYLESVAACTGYGPLFRQGAVPIVDKSGNFLGAIGCGGGSASQDEACATAGAAAI